MAENSKSKDIGLKIWLIFVTVITAICLAISGYLTYRWIKSVAFENGVVAISILIALPFLMYSTWDYYKSGNKLKAVIFATTMLIVSIIQALAMLYWSILLLFY